MYYFFFLSVSLALTNYLDHDLLVFKNVTRSIWNLSYAPYTVPCPSSNLIRLANESICEQEQRYISNRNRLTEKALLSIIKIPEFDIDQFWALKNEPIKIAISFSGGGYRSYLTGVGIISALDNRSLINSPLMGVLQSTSYIGGISGGSWLVLSQFVNDFPPMYKLKNSDGWNLKDSLLEGIPNFNPNMINVGKETTQQGNNTNLFHKVSSLFKIEKKKESEHLIQGLNSSFGDLKKCIEFYKQLMIEVRDKRKAGFHISLTDYWGRALSRKIFNLSARVPGITLTAARENLPSFQSFLQPFPIIGTIEKDPDTERNISISNLNSHLFEFTPFEFGSFESHLNSFIPVRYLGSKLNDGISVLFNNKSSLPYCISGFDNVGFIAGTSSSLFNHIFLFIYKSLESLPTEFRFLIENILKLFGLSSEWKSLKNPKFHPNYALYSPNPFYNLSTIESKHSSIYENHDLYLVDGGDDGQNILFSSFLIQQRRIDIILAYDMSNEVNNWPNGTVLSKTFQKYTQTNTKIPHFKLDNKTKSIFPNVPTADDFKARNINHPIVLGCDLHENYSTIETKDTDSTYKDDYLPPLIVYTGNTNYTYMSNTSTFKLSYTADEIDGMIDNGWNLATFMNNDMFGICMHCFILKRQFHKLTYPIPRFCQNCFLSYCY